jgi:hypothetical protein
MSRLSLSGVLAVLVTVGLVLGGRSLAQQEKGAAGGAHHHDEHATAFDKCARACTTCMRECESCANHCAHLVAAGKKQHLHTLGTCADCAEFCGAAARIVSHRGPMAGLICDSCAKACKDCERACEQTGAGDEHMQRCAKACRACADACREMIQHLGTKGATAEAPARQR